MCPAIFHMTQWSFLRQTNLLLSPLALSWGKALQKSRSVHEPKRHLAWRVTGDFEKSPKKKLCRRYRRRKNTKRPSVVTLCQRWEWKYTSKCSHKFPLIICMHNDFPVRKQLVLFNAVFLYLRIRECRNYSRQSWRLVSSNPLKNSCYESINTLW